MTCPCIGSLYILNIGVHSSVAASLCPVAPVFSGSGAQFQMQKLSRARRPYITCPALNGLNENKESRGPSFHSHEGQTQTQVICKVPAVDGSQQVPADIYRGE